MKREVEEFLRIGDDILLSSEIGGLLFAEGPIQPRVYLRDDSSQTDFSHDVNSYIFRLEPQYNYEANKTLRKIFSALKNPLFFETPGEVLNSEEVLEETNPQLERLRKAALAENEYNRAETQRLKGKVVLYGQIIQLRNIQYNKFLRVNTNQTTTHKGTTLIVDLSKMTSKKNFFRIMPKHRIRGEGEPIRVGDSGSQALFLVLQSIKTEGYLKAGLGTFTHEVFKTRLHEVYNSLNSFGWKVHCFSPTQTVNSRRLKGGHFVRLYHKEKEGYLQNLLGTNRVAVRPHVFNPLNPQESDSSLTFWKITLESTFNGGLLKGGVRCRIKCPISRLYLQVDLGSKTCDAVTGRVLYNIVLGPRKPGDDDNTLFELQSLESDDTNIITGSYTKFRHVRTQTWLHLHNVDELNGSKAANTLQRQYSFLIHTTHNDGFTVMATNQTSFDDCFTITRVDNELSETFNFVNTMSPHLDHFLVKPRAASSRKAFPIDPEEDEKIKKILTSLIYFSSRSGDMDPNRRIGLPITAHQDILRDSGIMAKILLFLRAPFSLEVRKALRDSLQINVKEVEGEAEVDLAMLKLDPVLNEMLFLSYRLTSQFLLGDHLVNQKYVFDYLPTFCKHIQYNPEAAQVIIRLLHGNREIIEKITTDQIDFFVEVALAERNPILLDILITLCSYPQQNQLPKTECRNNIVYVDDVATQTPVEMHEYLRSNPSQVRYFEAMLKFINAVCLGRNENSLSLVTEVYLKITLEKCLSCLFDEKLPLEIRTQYCNLIRVLYVDVYPMSPVSEDLIFVESEITNSSNYSVEGSLANMQNIKKLTKWIRTFFTEHPKLTKDEKLNTLIFAVLKLIKGLASFGFYHEHASIVSLIRTLTTLLDGRTNINEYGLIDESKPATDLSTINDERFHYIEKNKMIIDIKIEVCAVLELLFNLRTEIRVRKLLYIWLKNEGDQKRLSALDGENRDKASTWESSIEIIIRRIFMETRYINRETDLMPILIDLIKYRNQRLKQGSIVVMHRLYCDYEELFEKSKKSFILTQSHDIQVYYWIRPRVTMFLTLSLQHSHEHVGTRKMKEILKCFVGLCNGTIVVDYKGNLVPGEPSGAEKNKIAQRILFNMDLHTYVIGYLRRNTYGERKAEWFNEDVLDLFWACLAFLSVCCGDDRELHGSILVQNIDLLFELVSYDQRMVAPLIDIFSKSVNLCLRVEEHHMEHLLELSKGYCGEYLRLLRALVKVSGKIIKRNQLYIADLLLEKKDEYIVLEANHDIKQEPYFEAPPVAYQAALIDLVATCAEGENSLQSIFQSILPADQILDILANQESDHLIERAYLRFFIAVYLWTSRQGTTGTSYIFENPLIWAYVAKTCRLLGSFNHDLRHGDNQEAKSQIGIKSAYIYESVLIFLRLLFDIYFSSQRSPIAQFDVADDRQELGNNIVDELAALAELPPKSPKHLKTLVECMETLVVDSTLHGNKKKAVSKSLLNSLKIAQSKRVSVESPSVALGELNQNFQSFLSRVMDSGQIVESEKEEFRQLSLHFPLEESHPSGECSIESLVEYLSGRLNGVEDFRKEIYDIRTMRILRNLVVNVTEEIEQTSHVDQPLEWARLQQRKIEIQNKLNKLGCTLMAEKLLSSNSQKIYISAMKLLNALLDGGNKKVQDTLERYFLGTRVERFFYCVHHKLREGILSLRKAKELLIVDAKKRERSSTLSSKIRRRLRGHKSGLSISTSNFLNQILSHSDDVPIITLNLSHAKDDNKISKYLQNEDKIDLGTTAQDFEAVCHLMRLLQLMVEGHNYSLQTYFSVQGDNIKSFNLVTGVVDYLHAIVPITSLQDEDLTSQTMPVITQVFDTIIEMAQGCISNQVSIFNAKIVQSVNVILREPFHQCPAEQAVELKGKAVLCLLSLLEGGNIEAKAIFREMANTLDLDTINRNLRNLFEQSKNLTWKPGKQSAIDSGFLYCMLIMTLFTALTKEQQYRFQNEPAFIFFKRNTGQIEILRELSPGDKRVVPVLFPIPEVCRYLREDTKEHFLWNVKRDSADAKIEDFVTKSEDIIYEIESQARVARNWYLSTLSGYHSLWWQSAYVMTLLLNILGLMCAAVPENTVESSGGVGELFLGYGCQWFTEPLRICLGLIHLALWSLSSGEFLLIQLPILINRKRLEKLNQLRKQKTKEDVHSQSYEVGFMNDEDTLDNSHLDAPSSFSAIIAKGEGLSPSNLAEKIMYFVMEPKALYHVFMVLLSIGGLRYHMLYSIHLLDFIYRDQILQGVIASVTVNINSLTKTVLLGVIIIYVYSVVGFVYFRHSFDSEQGLYCDTLFDCFITVLAYGIRAGGGLGDILQAPVHGDNSYAYRIVLDLSFFLIVIIFLLNVIFGIIFDTFGSLRDERSSIQNDMKSVCFICNISATEFQRHAKGFEHHIRHDHNIWQYLFFLVHLKTKDVTEYTSQESYVVEMLKDNDYGFFPVNRALCLRQREKHDDQRITNLEEMITNLTNRLDQSPSSQPAKSKHYSGK
ncbi:hypothetical protein K493DRAFT_341790 [Basidiobolus meristosporus CBS 931.73]|uniref:Uncharacterized protein n=1 Tax=Basidiobolus meristosporus CBS 931.73 TaxID=1314790 RepID=A0A1Y1XHY3_9FUNG|nr:hypothetical protein K493DRAFT_341790 [Basidiobolus meristosporus CBS 931.73]|eukprot:ORX85369.1 hypothetical protein K493DRAFT_341790 [Basidiobolus meristosporus CBS 931.73]